MDQSINAHIKAAHVELARVWFEDATDLHEGEAVCYSIANGTATKKNGKRVNLVTRPTSENNNAFAGVASRFYPAETGGQFIDICCPGSRGVNVAIGDNVTINSGILTFTVGSGTAGGRFVKGGFAGRGSIVPRQTVASAVLLASMTGGFSLATDGVTLTHASNTDIAAGDTVVLLGGENEGSGKAIVPGKYVVDSVTSATVLVLSSSAVSKTPDGALTCTGYVYSGTALCQADLLTGEESGGVEFVSPPNTGDSDGAGLSFMSGGVSYICGGVTIATEAANGALANGEYLGQKKGFHCLGTLTTNDAQVTLETAGEQLAVTDAIDSAGDGSPLALAAATFDAAGEFLYLVWFGIWKESSHSGCALSAS